MRKRKQGRKLSRSKDQRRALLRSLARELLLRKKIQTTEAKAKEVARFAQKGHTVRARVIKLGRRKSDAAPMAIVELLS
ncbi:MAG: hypothetical protein HYS52_00330 [Candidatus Wildermuthbacteria bacterium]|nr:hypothetical protein [Candidatus Wildermuthbacteria bacterium]